MTGILGSDASQPGLIELGEVPAGAMASLSGTMVAGTVETDVVTGGQTIVITLTGATWIPA